MSVGISERGGTSVDVGLTKAGFNAGLSYNSKTGSVSGSAGFTSQSSGTGFALSYSEGDGFVASLSKSFSNGLNGGISWSEKGGVGGNIGYEAPGDKDKPKNSLANQMKGAGGTLSFSQRDGVSAALNASGGVNAGNWSQSGGFQANTNYLMDSWKADFVSKQGELEELQSKGLSKEQATAILDAQAHAESKAAQEKNNQESGKSVLDGAGYAATRKEGEDGVTSHSNGGDESHYYDRDGNMRVRVADSNGDVYYRAATPEEAHRIQNGNDLAMTSETKLSSNSKAGEEFTINGIKAKVSYNANGDPIMNLANGHTINTQTGGIFKQFEAKGLNSEVLHALNNKDAANAKIDSVDWQKGSRMHTANEGKQNGQADLMAKNLTPYSIFDTHDGTFKLKSWDKDVTAGNKAVIQFKDKQGINREVQIGHMANQIPKYVKDHFAMNPDTPLVLKTGTIFGYAGTTGNHYVGKLGQNSSKNGFDYDNLEKYVKSPSPHAHVVFRDAPGQKARPGYDVPSYATHLGWNP
ncbi:hypothetical protein [Leptospira weilii]|uniref:hypothetical protein n=1 Tax=Leptospira weilii TaxID=28184 RepID=UPI001E5FEE68|nr:hypothetical protein [Leptospira weilii]